MVLSTPAIPLWQWHGSEVKASPRKGDPRKTEPQKASTRKLNASKPPCSQIIGSQEALTQRPLPRQSLAAQNPKMTIWEFVSARSYAEIADYFTQAYTYLSRRSDDPANPPRSARRTARFRSPTDADPIELIRTGKLALMSLGEGYSPFVESLLESTEPDHRIHIHATDVAYSPAFLSRQLNFLKMFPDNYHAQAFQDLNIVDPVSGHRLMFDVIVSSFAFSYVVHQSSQTHEIQGILKRVLSHLKPGGVFIFWPYLGSEIFEYLVREKDYWRMVEKQIFNIPLKPRNAETKELSFSAITKKRLPKK